MDVENTINTLVIGGIKRVFEFTKSLSSSNNSLADKSEDEASATPNQTDITKLQQSLQMSSISNDEGSTPEKQSCSTEKPFTPKQWRPGSNLSYSMSLRNDSKKDRLSFNNMPKSVGKELDVNFHDCKYKSPLFRDKSLPLNMRIDHFLKHEEAVRKLASQMSRNHLSVAPIPKPLAAAVDLSFFEQQEAGTSGPPEEKAVQNLYTSRSGRQVKRKNYEETMDLENDEFEKTSKRNKVDETGDEKITLDNPYVPEDKPKPRRNSKPNWMTKNRTEILMENAEKEAEKKRQREQEIEIFRQNLSSDEDEDSQNIEQDVDDFVPKRVVPPNPGKRGRGKKAATLTRATPDFKKVPTALNKSSLPQDDMFG